MASLYHPEEGYLVNSVSVLVWNISNIWGCFYTFFIHVIIWIATPFSSWIFFLSLTLKLAEICYCSVWHFGTGLFGLSGKLAVKQVWHCVCCLCDRERKELKAKQAKHSMESVKSVMADKSVKNKAERDRYCQHYDTITLLHYNST